MKKTNKNDWRDFFGEMSILCDLKRDSEGKYTWKCNGKIRDNKSFAKQVIKKLNLNENEVLKKLEKTDGICDCETLMNSMRRILPHD